MVISGTRELRWRLMATANTITTIALYGYGEQLVLEMQMRLEAWVCFFFFNFYVLLNDFLELEYVYGNYDDERPPLPATHTECVSLLFISPLKHILHKTNLNDSEWVDSCRGKRACLASPFSHSPSSCRLFLLTHPPLPCQFFVCSRSTCTQTVAI